MRHIAIVALGLALGLPTALTAQVGADKCGSWEHAEVRLERLARYFVEDDYAGFRDGMVAQVDGDAPRYVVTERDECNPVIRAALKELRKQANWKELHRNGFEFNIFRYGSYYAVVVLENPPEGDMFGGGWAAMLVFEPGEKPNEIRYLGIRLV